MPVQYVCMLGVDPGKIQGPLNTVFRTAYTQFLKLGPCLSKLYTQKPKPYTPNAKHMYTHFASKLHTQTPNKKIFPPAARCCAESKTLFLSFLHF